MAHHDITVYRPDERPDVEVHHLADDAWYQAEALQRWRDDQGVWWYQCRWRRGPGQGTYTDDYPADQVREDQTDYSARATAAGLSVPDGSL